MQPQAIVVEDHPAHRHIAQCTLESQGIQVHCASTLLDGVALCETVLDITTTYRPTLILTDIMLPTQPTSALQCTLLLALIATGIEQGVLHPAWLIAISAEVTPAREMEVRLAGAHHVLEKPLRYPDQGVQFAQLLQQPPPYYNATAEQRCIRNTALQGLELLRSNSSVMLTPIRSNVTSPIRWTKETTQLLLSDPYHLCSDEPYRSWIRQTGDVAGIYDRIRAGLEHNDKHRQMLDVILGYKSERERVTHLNMSRATYYRQYQNLLQRVTTLLNTST